METVNIHASITMVTECVNVTVDTSYQLTRGTVRVSYELIVRRGWFDSMRYHDCQLCLLSA